MYKIVKAKVEDADEILKINSQFHLDMPDFKWDTKEWVLPQIKEGKYYVIKEGSLILGAIHIEKRENEYHISTIAIRKEMHRKNLGTSLINFAKQLAIKDNASVLTVGSFVDYNAEEFYIKCGFTEKRIIKEDKGHSYYEFEMRI